MACLQNYWEHLSFATFQWTYSNSKEVSYLPSSLDKIIILIWRLLNISSQIFPCELNSSRTYSLENIYVSATLIITPHSLKIYQELSFLYQNFQKVLVELINCKNTLQNLSIWKLMLVLFVSFLNLTFLLLSTAAAL